MRQSNLLSLNWRDYLRAFLVAFIYFLLTYIQNNVLPTINLDPSVIELIKVGIAYLLKNLGTSPDAQKIVGDRPKDSGGR